MDQQPYNVNININQPGPQQYGNPPAQALPTDRGILKVFLLTFFTLGIYALVLRSKMIREINLTAAADGKKTTGLFAMILLSIVTFGIYGIVWTILFVQRIENENKRRGTGVSFGIADWIIFSVLLSWTGVCPLIFMHKELMAFNAINASYNQFG